MSASLFARALARAARLQKRVLINRTPEGQLFDKIGDLTTRIAQNTDSLAIHANESLTPLISRLSSAANQSSLAKEELRQISRALTQLDNHYNGLGKATQVLLQELRIRQVQCATDISSALISDVEKSLEAIRKVQDSLSEADKVLMNFTFEGSNIELIPAFLGALDEVQKSLYAAGDTMAIAEQTAVLIGEKNLGNAVVSSIAINGSVPNDDLSAATYTQVSLDGTGIVGLIDLVDLVSSHVNIMDSDSMNWRLAQLNVKGDTQDSIDLDKSATGKLTAVRTLPDESIVQQRARNTVVWAKAAERNQAVPLENETYNYTVDNSLLSDNICEFKTSLIDSDSVLKPVSQLSSIQSQWVSP